LFSMTMVNSQHHQLFSASSVFDNPTPGLFRAGEVAVYRVAFDNILGPDRYFINAAVALLGGVTLQLRERMMAVMVTRVTPTGTLVDIPYAQSVTRADALTPETLR
ncbi:MAG: type transport system ATP-binding protein, partial [Solirubrobacteraceae bacterium]|nr:type transport system ATP-binding protein [Solirubrobacteraceae bacterium]